MPDHFHELLAPFDAAAPLSQARTIPATWYRDPGIFECERRAVFANSWQWVGRTDQVARPGQFITANVAGTPVLVTRDEQNTLHAFINVCRHRAARVVPEECGSLDRLRCRYHGWTYDLAGRLRGVPEWEGVEDFRREDNGLVPLAVDAWGPFVFVHLGDNPSPLAESL